MIEPEPRHLQHFCNYQRKGLTMATKKQPHENKFHVDNGSRLSECKEDEMSKRKIVRMVVDVSVPVWMSPRDAQREVRTLINEQCGYLSNGPHGEDVVIRTTKVAPMDGAV